MTSLPSPRTALLLACALAAVACQAREREGGSDLVRLDQTTAVGVPECDDFLAKYDACLKDRVPGTDRGQLAATLTERRASWRRLASDAQTRTTLPSACALAAQTARDAMRSFGCAW